MMFIVLATWTIGFCVLMGGLVCLVIDYDKKISFQLIHAGVVSMILSIIYHFYLGAYPIWMT